MEKRIADLENPYQFEVGDYCYSLIKNQITKLQVVGGEYKYEVVLRIINNRKILRRFNYYFCYDKINKISHELRECSLVKNKSLLSQYLKTKDHE